MHGTFMYSMLPAAFSFALYLPYHFAYSSAIAFRLIPCFLSAGFFKSLSLNLSIKNAILKQFICCGFAANKRKECNLCEAPLLNYLFGAYAAEFVFFMFGRVNAACYKC